MVAPPSGTVTFLFTDVENSTRLWEKSPESMEVSLRRHDAILREAIEEHGGFVFKTVGDAFCATFPAASGALQAALAAQEALLSEPWEAQPDAPLRARMALHTGAAQERDGDYFGPPSTGWRGCSRRLMAGRCSSLLRPRSWCEISYRRTRT